MNSTLCCWLSSLWIAGEKKLLLPAMDGDERRWTSKRAPAALQHRPGLLAGAWVAHVLPYRRSSPFITGEKILEPVMNGDKRG